MIAASAHLDAPGSRAVDLRTSACVFLAFTLLAALYFSHALLSGKLIASDDAYAYAYPLQSYARQGFSLWLPWEFAGMPFLGLLQTGLLYPPNLLLSVLPAPIAFNAGIILHFALAGFFTFRYLRLVGLRAEAAIFGGIAFAFTGFFAAHRVHISMMNAAAWTPLLFYFYERIRLTLDRRAALWAALAIAVQLLAGHVQTCAYTYLLLAGYSVFHWLRSGRSVRLGVLLCVPIVLGCVIALPQLLAGAELAGLSARTHNSYESFTSFSLEPRLLPTLVLPFVNGGGSYGYDLWGGASTTEKAGFTGFFCLALAAYCVARCSRASPHAAFWAVVALVSILLAFGRYNPLYRLLYHVPLCNLFRVTARSLLGFNLAIAVLAAFGFQQVFCVEQESGKRRAFVAGAIVSIAAIAVLAAWIVHWQASRRFPLTSMVVLVPLLFACGGILLLLVGGRMKTARGWIIAIALVLVFAEACSFGSFIDNHLWPTLAGIRREAANPVNEFLRQNIRDGRALYLTKSTRTLYNVPLHISTLNGYDPLILRDFHQLLNMEAEGFCKNWNELLANTPMLSALSVRYIVSDRVDFDRLIAESGEHAYGMVFQDGDITVYENRRCLPRAFTVRRVKPAEGIGEIGREFVSSGFDPSETAFVSPSDAGRIGGAEFATGTAHITRYEGGEVRIDAAFAGTGFLVLADQYYPRWRAYVDGRETAICKVNGLLRGIVVPPGSHSIMFAYRPRHIYVAAIVGIVCLAGCVVFIMVPVGRRLRGNISAA